MDRRFVEIRPRLEPIAEVLLAYIETGSGRFKMKRGVLRSPFSHVEFEFPDGTVRTREQIAEELRELLGEQAGVWMGPGGLYFTVRARDHFHAGYVQGYTLRGRYAAEVDLEIVTSLDGLKFPAHAYREIDERWFAFICPE